MNAADRAEWTWFPWGVLRGAGFPVQCVDALRDEAARDAAEELISCDRELERAAGAVRPKLLALGSSHRRRLARALRARRSIDASEPDITPEVSDWNAALCRRELSFTSFLNIYERTRVNSARRLQAAFADDGVRRAVLWQNRRSIGDLARAKDSWDERTLLKYIARYSTKNDTIGFFGPVAWFRLVNEPGFAAFRCGPSVIRRTSLSFEVWPIARIAELLSDRGDLRPWLSPRRSALCRIQGRQVLLPPDQRLEVNDEDVDLLIHCDGQRSAHEITGGSTDAMSRLVGLCERGLITWTLDCPLEQHPEGAIARLAQRIDDPTLRAVVDAHLAWIDQVRAGLQHDMDSSPALERALARADREFEERYSLESVRSAGQYYAGRTLTYIDCERDVVLDLKVDLTNTLMRGLTPILLSLRWYTYAVATRLCDEVATLVPIGAHRPLAAVFPALMSLVWSTVRVVADEYRDKWRRLLSIDPALRLASLDADALALVVTQVFAAPYPGWPTARAHNPDVLIAAASVDELAQGRYTITLGEVHASLPSMFQGAIFSACAEPDAVRDAFHAVVPPPPIINEVTARLNLGAFFTDAAQLWLPDEPVTHRHVRPIADFDVVHDSLSVSIRDVTTDEVWALPVFFDSILSRATFHVEPFDDPQARHRPRVRIGEVIVAREMWRITAADVGVRNHRRADPLAHSGGFLGVRRWARDHDVPRHVFAKSPQEPKPLFLDLESHACVELLAHLLRRAAESETQGAVTLTEMLPAPHQCWLHDAQDHRYTSEVRLLAIDPVAYPSARRAP